MDFYPHFGQLYYIFLSNWNIFNGLYIICNNNESFYSMTSYIRIFLPFLTLIILSSCRSPSETWSISYDPPGATTETKSLDIQHKRTIGADGVWVSNEFDGGRLNDFYHIDENRFRAEIHPENAPINRSAWYAFRVWSEEDRQIEIELVYRDGQHRYIPKLSTDAIQWAVIDSSRYTHDRENLSANLVLNVSSTPLWVSAQELFTSSHFRVWLDTLSQSTFVDLDVIGTSKLGRDIHRLIINDTGNEMAPAIIVTGRQHPPEVTGALGQRIFIETILGDDPIAQAFRKRYQVIVYPLVNPDGVDEGHWRHNAGGVDLNRDWGPFNQPETRAIRDDLLVFKNRGLSVFYSLDFHSTSYDVFYTINKDIPVRVPGLTDKWLEGIVDRVPHYSIREEPSGVAPPIAKNWMYHTFDNADGVTYEVGDDTPRELIDEVVSAAALSLMEQLLNVD